LFSFLSDLISSFVQKVPTPAASEIKAAPAPTTSALSSNPADAVAETSIETSEPAPTASVIAPLPTPSTEEVEKPVAPKVGRRLSSRLTGLLGFGGSSKEKKTVTSPKEEKVESIAPKLAAVESQTPLADVGAEVSFFLLPSSRSPLLNVH
jgi:hypothetical protein